MSDLLYCLNASDEIESVNDAWLSFAQANQAEFLVPAQILGRSLWDFVGDLETRHIYRLLHKRVRTQRGPVELPFRCDAPDRRRFLELEISPGEGQGLNYRVRTVKEEDRPRVALLDPGLPRSEVFVTMCGWCKRVAVPEQGWLEVETASVALGFFDEPRPPQLTHGVCDECSRRLHQTMATSRR